MEDEPIISIMQDMPEIGEYQVICIITCSTKRQADATEIALAKLICGEEIKIN